MYLWDVCLESHIRAPVGVIAEVITKVYCLMHVSTECDESTLASKSKTTT
jgi:hypothetical protein